MICCEECGGVNPRLHYRLDPRNWHERRRLLCVPCGKRLGFAPRDFSRPSVEGTRAPVRRGRAAA